MATRFYLPETEAAPVTPPSPGAEWEHNLGTTRKLLTTADSSTLTTTAYTPDAADHITDADALHRQYVSDALAAQTISGSITAQLQCLEVIASNNQFLAMVVKVISNDGTTTRATLLSITRDTTNELNTALTNRNFPSTALTSYACADGDRLLVEIGIGGLPSAVGGTQGHNGSIRWGCNASSGDLPADDSTTATTYRPWVEISNTLSFSTGAITVTPTTAALVLTTYVPAILTPILATVLTASLAFASFAPTVTVDTPVTPTTASLILTTLAPTVTATDHQSVTPATASLSLTTYVPTVTVSDPNVTVTPSPATLATSAFAPSVTASDHQIATPGLVTIALSAFAPTIAVSDHQTVIPATTSLVLTGYLPTVSVSGGVVYVRSVAAIMSARRRRHRYRK